MNRNAISLFSSSGIGDLGLKANGIKTVIANELLAERMKLFQNNYPDAKCFLGDIWELQEDIIEYYKANYDEAPFMILATPLVKGCHQTAWARCCQIIEKDYVLKWMREID